MANNCFYKMVAVAPKRESLERLIKIMNYKDNEYFIYRCFSAYAFDIAYEDGLYTVCIEGDVAWSTTAWFEGIEKPDEIITLGYEDGDFQKPIYGTAHYVSLDIVCRKLDIGIEVFAEESGCCFQSWYICDHDGCIRHDVADWTESWCDDDGNELDEPHTEGGLDFYGEFSCPAVIYG